MEETRRAKTARRVSSTLDAERDPNICVALSGHHPGLVYIAPLGLGAVTILVPALHWASLSHLVLIYSLEEKLQSDLGVEGFAWADARRSVGIANRICAAPEEIGRAHV